LDGRRKAFFGATGLAAFIIVYVYGLVDTLPILLCATDFVVSAYAIYGFTAKLSKQEHPSAAQNEPVDKTAEPRIQTPRTPARAHHDKETRS